MSFSLQAYHLLLTFLQLPWVPWRIVLQWWALLEHSNVILLKDCSASSNGMTQIKGLWRLYLHVKEIQCHGKRSSQCRGPDVGNFSPFQVQKKDSLMLGLCLCSATRYSKAQSSSLLLVASAVHCRLALLCPCHSLREDRSADNWIFNTLVSVVILSEESCALLHVPQVVLLIIYYGKSGSSHLLKLQTRRGADVPERRAVVPKACLLFPRTTLTSSPEALLCADSQTIGATTLPC
ncbi:uncharacterized protein LOC110359662 isoform X3 [Columba livia]|uniref:uncharacterized protein LOC110359662 isoform X3 n=1 Tax=Columba livia TaxID=8932 RepID=UPI0031BB64D3